MKNITVQYGTSTRQVEVSQNATVGEIMADATTRIILGYGDSVQALIGGVTQPNDACPPSGTTILVENRANQKAN
jgi:hypothetical protein